MKNGVYESNFYTIDELKVKIQQEIDCIEKNVLCQVTFRVITRAQKFIFEQVTHL